MIAILQNISIIQASTIRRPDNLIEKQAFGSSRCMLTQVHLTEIRYSLRLEFKCFVGFRN